MLAKIMAIAGAAINTPGHIGLAGVSLSAKKKVLI